MKKLTTLLAALAMTTTLAGGCGSKKNQERKDDTTATKPIDETKPSTTETTPTAKPGDTTTTPPAAPSTDFPAECTAYKVMVDKLAECQKLATETRDNLKNAFQQSWTVWEKTPDKKTIVEACKAGTETVRAAAATTCGW
jgi:hypothetical protein